MSNLKCVMDCECLHNWVNRKFYQSPYFTVLPTYVLNAIRVAHDDHHNGKGGASGISTVEHLQNLCRHHADWLMIAEHP